MKRLTVIISLVMTIMGFGAIKSQDQFEHFNLLSNESLLSEIKNVHVDFLGYKLLYPVVESVPDFIRGPELVAPGDYFRYPAGADEMQLTDTDKKEITDALNVVVNPRYYDLYILDNLTGYEYQLLGGKVSRREYYVKYGGGDTIYVISGLLGEFLSFYRAIPREFRLSIDQLKAEAKELSPIVELEDNDKFVEKENNYIYFVEYVDKDRMLRVRNYQIVKYTKDEAEAKEFPKGRYYNLIEITKFLDEEAMP
jgi:hypothetical protein